MSAIVQKSKEIITDETLIQYTAVIALIGKQDIGVSSNELTVIKGSGSKEQQILELFAIAVIQHLAQQAVSHCVTRATGELVKHL